MGMRTGEGVNGLPKEITLRNGCERDLPYIRDVDLKSTHYPWTTQAWDKLVDPDYKLCVAVHRAEPIGFVVYSPGDGCVDILKICVKPLHRGCGVGTALLDYVLDYARVERKSSLMTTVGEILCLPGHPDDVSVWLSKYGFRTEAPIVKKHAYMYGQWIDGFRFIYTLGDKE